MVWTLNQWNQVVVPNRPQGFTGSSSSGWLTLDPGLRHIVVRLDVDNAGLFTSPFDRHPFNDPALQIAYQIETSIDGTDANAGYLCGGTVQGSTTGTWPVKGNLNQSFPTGSADLPQTPYPGFYRATYTVLNAATVTFGVSVLPT